MITWTRYGGGWGYDSDCGRFSIHNLKHVGGDGRPNSGWAMHDRKNDDCIGYAPTLKEAKKECQAVKDNT